MNKTPWVALALSLVPLLSLPASARDGCGALAAERVLDAIAQARAQGAHCGRRGAFAAAAPLRWSPALERVARQQASWVAEAGQLSHSGRDGQTLAQRAQAAGYHYARIAENLAQGQHDLPETIAAWTASDGHCANLFDGGVSEMALVCAPAGNGQPIWVLVLGRPMAAAGPAPRQ